MRFLLPSLAGVALAVINSPASAAWNVAQSKHFVIYADEKPEQLSQFAAKLERFDQAARYIYLMQDPPVGRGNRLTVFVLPSVEAVERLAGDTFIKGFYKGLASGSVAFVPRTTDHRPGNLDADTIFFHEYAHHLMFQDIDRPFPQWYVEGFAEFLSTVRFESDGSIGIGAPATHRAWTLFRGRELPLETLLAGNYSKLSPELLESVYGRGWLLVHYLNFEQSRRGQLDRYADLLGKGVPSLDAARTAFGDLKQLDRDLDQYLDRKKTPYIKLAGNRFKPGPISVQPLSEAASKIIMLRIELKRGSKKGAEELLASQVRAVEGRYPGDNLVELTLCEAELQDARPEAAEPAADRALKADPQDTKSMICKGRAVAERSKKLTGPARHAGFEQARSLFVGANKIDTEDPEALWMYFRTFVTEGVRPTPNAIEALHYASDLAPQDAGVRMGSAVAYLNEGKLEEAKSALTPIAYDPHGRELSQVARAMIERIDAGDGRGALMAGLSGQRPGPSAP
jgi:tetratricopeptide (TPR) repeat protein